MINLAELPNRFLILISDNSNIIYYLFEISIQLIHNKSINNPGK